MSITQCVPTVLRSITYCPVTMRERIADITQLALILNHM